MAFLPGILAGLGYEAWGVDDFRDPWQEPEAVQEIYRFAERSSVHLVRSAIEDLSPDQPWDGASLVDVIEHLHVSPRVVLNQVGAALGPNGVVIVVMPNSVNLRKRIAVLSGKSNYPPLGDFFHSQGLWRGHVREFTMRETVELLRLSGYRVVDSRCFDAIALDRLRHEVARITFLAATSLWRSVKDSHITVGRRPAGWRPVEADTSRQPDMH
jgi:SAM-dependent methyltransferase